MRVFEQTIRTLVDENYVYARALNYLGVEFYLYPDRKLREICVERNLDKDQVLKTFYLLDRSYPFSFKELDKYPLEIVIEYLKHSHHLFIKDKLPYIAKLISKYPGQEDMKLIFPEFVEEFINHIYEEEDTLFRYIGRMIKIEKQIDLNPLKELWGYSEMNLEKALSEHKEEDELAGIRNLLEESSDTSMHWQVISKEIKAFDRELWYHAQIENMILLPKAIVLEGKIKERIIKLSKLN